MDQHLTFLTAMNRGRPPAEGVGPEKAGYCVFYGPMETQLTGEHITGDSEHMVLELTYGAGDDMGALRIRQAGTSAVVEESSQGAFLTYLDGRPIKYVGHLMMYALLFKIDDLRQMVDRCAAAMRHLEDHLDNKIDNSGTYQILDFRRQYADCGASLINVQEILTRISKGYYPMQMANSYVLQGEVELQFRFLMERYDLVKNTLIKDLDTYTSIVNNNINRNARNLSILSLAAVALNFIFGSLVASYPLVGILGGLSIAGITVAVALYYRRGNRAKEEPVPLEGSHVVSLHESPDRQPQAYHETGHPQDHPDPFPPPIPRR